jgi:hypothetical protein
MNFEIDIVADVKADVHHAREGRAHVIERLGEARAAAGGLLGIPVLQELDHDIVELDEAHVQAQPAAPQVRDAHGPWIDPAHARLDLLIGQQRVVNALTVKIAVAHHLGAAEHLGVEFVGAVHVLHRQPEMLHALQPRAERPAVSRRRACRRTGLRRSRRGGRGRGRQPADHGRARARENGPALRIEFIGLLTVTHAASPFWCLLVPGHWPDESRPGPADP